MNQTAILYFSRHSSEELKYKTFFGSDKKLNRQIAQQLYQDTLKTIESTKLPVFHLSEEEQQGDTFGERITHAFESIFQSGYQKVIAIGSDCPGLTKEHILLAASQLNEQKVVLGPTPEGGCYLIGVCANAYQKQHFIELPWKTSGLLKRFLSAFKNTYQLPLLMDINKEADFYKLRSGDLSIAQLNKWLSWLSSYQVDIHIQLSAPNYFSFHHSALKGRAP